MSGVLMLLMASGGMGVTLSDSTVNGSANGTPPTPILVTSETVTATVSGGISPYTYAWTKVSGDDVDITAPTAATTAFSETQVPGTLLTGVYRCTVTDAAMLTASADCTVVLNFVDIS